MLKFRQYIEENMTPLTMQEELQIRHGGWISESYASMLCEEAKLTGPGQERERVSAEQEGKYNEKVAPILQHFHDEYGAADPKPPSEKVVRERIKGRFKELDDMKARDPKEYKRTISAANKRLKMKNGTTLGHPCATNAKTDTVNQIPGKDAPNGHIPVSMAFTPDTARHFTGTDPKKFKEYNRCSGSSEGCRRACLAMTGNYNFTGNKVLMDAHRTQRVGHNEEATRHHATLVHGALSAATEQADKSGKGVIVRSAISDDRGPEEHDEAIKQSFPRAKLMRYTKKLPKKVDGGDYEHDSDGQHQHTWSDTGPVVNRETDAKTGEVKKTVNQENISRRRLLDHKVKTLPRYMVFNKHRGAEDAGGGNIDHLKRVRKYETESSTPEPGEQSNYHHPDGHGRVEHNGKSYRYQDHPVVPNATTTDGKSLRPYEHDARVPEIDKPKETLKTRDGKKAGGIIPSLSVKSTPKKEFERSGFFHATENIDHNGVYHDGHPAEMEAAGHDEEAARQKGSGPATVIGKKDK